MCALCLAERDLVSVADVCAHRPLSILINSDLLPQAADLLGAAGRQWRLASILRLSAG